MAAGPLPRGAGGERLCRRAFFPQPTQDTMDSPILNLSRIQYAGHSTGEWDRLVAAMNPGDPVLVSPSVSDYFRDVLPLWRVFAGGFAFKEGDELPKVFVYLWEWDAPALGQSGPYPITLDALRARIPAARSQLTAESGFSPALVRIERHRMSATQGEVSIYYDGRKLGRFGDDTRLISTSRAFILEHWHPDEVREGDGRSVLAGWAGQPDAYWIEAARRELMREPSRAIRGDRD